MAGIHKSLSELQRMAEGQGWEVTRTPGGHLKWRPPVGDPYTTSSTPSDEGIIKTIRNDLSKKGLIIDRGEARRIKKKIRAGVPDTVSPDGKPALLAATRAAWVRPNKPLREWTDDEILNGIHDMDTTAGRGLELPMEKLSRRQRQAYAEMIRRADDYPADENGESYWPTTCATCGFDGAVNHVHGDQSLGLYVHLINNRDHNPTPPEGATPLDRDMTTPPARERLDCPLCPEWFWISQTEARATHAAAEHGKAECPYCHQWFSIVKGGLGKHMRSCTKGGEQAIEAARSSHPATVQPEPVTLRSVPPMATTGQAKHSDSWNPDPCLGGCNQPVGENPGKSHCIDCENLLEAIRKEEREAEAAREQQRVAAVAADLVQFPPQPGLPEHRTHHGDGPPRRRGPAVAADVTVPPAPAAPEPVAAAPAPTPAPEPQHRTADMTDDELFVLLEMVLDGPVILDRQTFATVNEWMDVTRRLLSIKYGQEK